MKYNSIGEQLIAKAQELDPNYKPDKFNDMSEAIDVILNNSGGSSEDDRKLVLKADFASTDEFNYRIPITKDVADKIKNIYFYEIIVVYKDEVPLATFQPYFNSEYNRKGYFSRFRSQYTTGYSYWYGTENVYPADCTYLSVDQSGNKFFAELSSYGISSPSLDKNKFDELYQFKMVNAPTEDGTYTLKCSVSGGIPTYSWVKNA